MTSDAKQDQAQTSRPEQSGCCGGKKQTSQPATEKVQTQQPAKDKAADRHHHGCGSGH